MSLFHYISGYINARRQLTKLAGSVNFRYSTLSSDPMFRKLNPGSGTTYLPVPEELSSRAAHDRYLRWDERRRQIEQEGAELPPKKVESQLKDFDAHRKDLEKWLAKPYIDEYARSNPKPMSFDQAMRMGDGGNARKFFIMPSDASDNYWQRRHKAELAYLADGGVISKETEAARAHPEDSYLVQLDRRQRAWALDALSYSDSPASSAIPMYENAYREAYRQKYGKKFEGEVPYPTLDQLYEYMAKNFGPVSQRSATNGVIWTAPQAPALPKENK